MSYEPMSRFISLTLGNIPWFAGAILLFAAVGYIAGDLPKLSSVQLLSTMLTGPATVLVLSAAGAGQTLFRERREKRRHSN
jgi:hypothetical protein